MTSLALWSKRLLASAMVVLGTGGVAVAGPGNAAVEWNAVARQAFIPTQGSDPLTQSITYAMLHAAIHDALNAIEQRYESYTPGLLSMPGASPEAAIAAAARDVLVARIPTQQSLIESAYASALAAIANGPAEDRGIVLGKVCGRRHPGSPRR